MNYRNYKIWDKDRTEIRKAVVPYKPGHKQFWLMLAGVGVLSISILGGIVGIFSTASITPYSVVQQSPIETTIVNRGYEPYGKRKIHIVVRPTPTGTKSNKCCPTLTPTKLPPAEAAERIQFPYCYHQPGWFYGWHNNGSTFEYGTDFDCSYHTPVVNIWSGLVVGAYRTEWPVGDSYNSAGGIVIVKCYIPDLGSYEDVYYLHVDWIYVYVGETVPRGTILAISGGQVGYGHWPTSPWFTSGPHLEIGFDYPYVEYNYQKADGYNRNPLYWIEENT